MQTSMLFTALLGISTVAIALPTGPSLLASRDSSIVSRNDVETVGHSTLKLRGGENVDVADGFRKREEVHIDLAGV
ncbi:hypothetical protein F4677DRAFT_25480 [Hypoxylon crocopeplum]|nr:hypothetical protein F4677DRAFT_25480 [Hypoxylon crocopeplum]